MPELEPLKLEAVASVSQTELAAAFSGPAPYANKIYLTLTPVTGRLTFMEVPPQNGEPVFRSAVCLALHDLLQLRDLITNMLVDAAPIPTGAAEQAADAPKA